MRYHTIEKIHMPQWLINRKNNEDFWEIGNFQAL